MQLPLTVFYFLAPVIVLVLRSRIKLIDKLGAVTVCYILGLILGNVPSLAVGSSAEDLSGVVVAIAIPLLLFSSDFKAWRTMGAPMAKAFAACIVAVVIAVSVGTWLFAAFLEEAWKLGSMMVGVYTGGTLNMGAIGKSVDVPNEAFVVLYGADMVIGGALLLFLLSAAKRVFGRFLNRPSFPVDRISLKIDDQLYWRGSTVALVLGVVILVIAHFVASAGGRVFAGAYVPLVFLIVTTLGLGASLVRPVRRLPGSFGMGNYLLLVFCIVVGSLADVDRILDGGLLTVSFVGIIMLITVALHLLFAHLLKIDTDTFIISSTAALFGPPFIPPVARAIGNPQIISLGIAIGLLGFAIGTYLGIAMSYVLRYL